MKYCVNSPCRTRWRDETARGSSSPHMSASSQVISGRTKEFFHMHYVRRHACVCSVASRIRYRLAWSALSAGGNVRVALQSLACSFCHQNKKAKPAMFSLAICHAIVCESISSHNKDCCILNFDRRKNIKRRNEWDRLVGNLVRRPWSCVRDVLRSYVEMDPINIFTQCCS